MSSGPSLAAGVGLGVAIGLGLNAKYAMIYLALCYAVYAAVSPKARATLKHPGTWAALAIALLLIAPNLVWNAGINSRPSSTPATTSTGTAGFPMCLACSPISEPRSAIIGPVPFAAFALAAVGRVAGVEGEPAAIAAGHVAAGLPADRRAGADFQGQRQLGGDRISGRRRCLPRRQWFPCNGGAA